MATSTITKELLIPLPLPKFPPYLVVMDFSPNFVILIVASTCFKFT
jgi:hypothetical protein